MSEESPQIFEIDVERFDCKRSQCLFVDKLVHSNSLINVQPEENCRIDELLCCSVGRLYRRGVLVGKAIENVQVLEAEKKIGVD